MTKTEATKRARAQMRLGHYRPEPNRPHGYVFCPECRAKVSTEWLPWEKAEPSLRGALVTHLVADCED